MWSRMRVEVEIVCGSRVHGPAASTGIEWKVVCEECSDFPWSVVTRTRTCVSHQTFLPADRLRLYVWRLCIFSLQTLMSADMSSIMKYTCFFFHSRYLEFGQKSLTASDRVITTHIITYLLEANSMTIITQSRAGQLSV